MPADQMSSAGVWSWHFSSTSGARKPRVPALFARTLGLRGTQTKTQRVGRERGRAVDSPVVLLDNAHSLRRAHGLLAAVATQVLAAFMQRTAGLYMHTVHSSIGHHLAVWLLLCRTGVVASALPFVSVEALRVEGERVRPPVHHSQSVCAPHLGKTKVAERALTCPGVVEKVGRLDVTVDDVACMCTIQCAKEAPKVALEVGERHDAIVLLERGVHKMRKRAHVFSRLPHSLESLHGGCTA